MSQAEKFTFFFGLKYPFSQFHPAKFSAKCLFGNDKNDQMIEFAHCEQWMMYHKAILFNDPEIANEILANSADQKMCKKLGRKVKNFDDGVWRQEREKVVFEGNKQKFLQNEDLLKQLVATKGTTLVEASPRDRVWGIGMGAGNPKAQSRSTWRGSNLLGQILTRLRDELIQTQDETASSTSKAKAIEPLKNSDVSESASKGKDNQNSKKAGKNKHDQDSTKVSKVKKRKV